MIAQNICKHSFTDLESADCPQIRGSIWLNASAQLKNSLSATIIVTDGSDAIDDDEHDDFGVCVGTSGGTNDDRSEMMEEELEVDVLEVDDMDDGE